MDDPRFYRNRLLLRRALMLGLMLLFFLLDRLSKKLVVSQMLPGESWPLWPGVFHLTYVKNTGIAFSLFQEHPQALVIITSVFFTAFLLFGLMRKTLPNLVLGGFGLILGGALGNLYDRLVHQGVVDYFDVVLINYPVFNVADAFIFLGIVLLIIHTLLHD